MHYYERDWAYAALLRKAVEQRRMSHERILRLIDRREREYHRGLRNDPEVLASADADLQAALAGEYRSIL